MSSISSEECVPNLWWRMVSESAISASTSAMGKRVSSPTEISIPDYGFLVMVLIWKNWNEWPFRRLNSPKRNVR